MAKILSFVEITNISEVHINMEMYKVKLINEHIKDGEIIHFKACG